MSLIRGTIVAFAALILGLFATAHSARADSLLDLSAADPNHQLVVQVPQVSWTPSYNDGTTAIGILKIENIPFSSSSGGTIGVLGVDMDAKYVYFNTPDTGITGSPITDSPFTITATVQITKSGSTYTGAATAGSMDIQGQVTADMVNFTHVSFNQSNTLSTFAINLDGSTNFAALQFTGQSSDYFTNGPGGAVVAEIRYLKTSGGGLVPSGSALFATAVGSTANFDPGDFKADVFGVSLPLPAPFYLGAIMFGIAGIAVLKGRTLFPAKA